MRCSMLLALAACSSSPASRDAPADATYVVDAACTGRPDRPRVLVFSAENLWMHPANPVAQQALVDMCGTRGFSVTATRDAAALDTRVLADIDVVVFALTSGPVLDDRARGDFEAWVRAGGGFVGIHTPDATEQQWPFFVELIGATFRTHAPGIWPAELTVEATAHPIAEDLPPRFASVDEFHVFNERPEELGLEIVLAVDEATLPADYPADLRVGYHPIAWAHAPHGGRSFFTCQGHDPALYADEQFLGMLARSIEWAAERPL